MYVGMISITEYEDHGLKKKEKREIERSNEKGNEKEAEVSLRLKGHTATHSRIRVKIGVNNKISHGKESVKICVFETNLS